ncbi:hypothetical protein [Sphingosinicella terrae]|uniref:hypothetical protein n=1 Tax=Sphingosinicella terrae TaxID=2172047 RepID=UPI000E0DADBE|nr:hypothetical protein [Sphingosinicella terrae]
MSYTDQESPFTARRMAAALGGIVIMFVIGLALRAGSSNDGDGTFQSLQRRSTTVERAEAELARDGRSREMMAAFKANYPQEYDQFLRRVVDAVNRRGSAAARQEAFTFMETFVRSKVPHIAEAPDADVNRLGDALVDFSAALREADISLCARFQMGGLTAMDRLPESALPAMSRLNVAQFRAARQAENGRRVPRTALSDADAEAWFARIETIDPESARRIADDRLPAATPQQQCDAGLAIYQAAMELPPTRSANVVAELIRQASTPPR